MLFLLFHTHPSIPNLCIRRQRRQRAQNAASGTAATSTAGTLSAATPSPRHGTAAKTPSTVWTPSDHAHDRPRRRTYWSPAAAAMVGQRLSMLLAWLITDSNWLCDLLFQREICWIAHFEFLATAIYLEGVIQYWLFCYGWLCRKDILYR